MTEKIEKHLEVRTYHHNGIGVRVRVDYDKETIDLLDNAGTAKRWVFAGRTLEYMAGWRNILTAMEHAIGLAEADLKKHVTAKEKEKKAMEVRVMRSVGKERRV